jgi:hypothetical protein
LQGHGGVQRWTVHWSAVACFFGREAAKTAGGRWDPEKQLWFVQYVKIEGTPLEKHIYVDEK